MPEDPAPAVVTPVLTTARVVQGEVLNQAPRELVVRLEGLPATVTKPQRSVAGIVALSVLTVGFTWAAYQAAYGNAWIAEARKAVHTDTSAISVQPRDDLKGLRPGEIELTVTNETGRIIKVAANRTALTAYEKEVIIFLKYREDAALTAFNRDVKAAFDSGFEGCEEALNAYADWFFAWGNSWTLMKEAIKAGGSEVLNIFSPSKIWDAITARVRGFMTEQYQSRVLRPDERNPKIQRGLDASFRTAHARFRSTVDDLHARERQFIKTHTRLLEAYPADAVNVKLDWAAQRWKIPAHYAEDRAEKAYRSAAIIGTSIAVAPLLTPIVSRVGTTTLNRLAGRVIISRSGQLTGGAFAIETLGLSLLIGVAVDYAVNKLDEKLSRDGFIREHRAALAETRTGWEKLALDQLSPTVGGWYAGTRQAIVLATESKS